MEQKIELIDSPLLIDPQFQFLQSAEAGGICLFIGTIRNKNQGKDVNALTIENTGGTDHVVFDYYKIPAFQIIQDELNYSTVTHHTISDVLEYVPERDMMINATVLAALVYQIAQEDVRLPRED